MVTIKKINRRAQKVQILNVYNLIWKNNLQDLHNCQNRASVLVTAELQIKIKKVCDSLKKENQTFHSLKSSGSFQSVKPQNITRHTFQFNQNR